MKRRSAGIGYSNYITEYAKNTEKLSKICSSQGYFIKMSAKKSDMSAFMREEFYRNYLSLDYASYIIGQSAKNIKAQR